MAKTKQQSKHQQLLYSHNQFQMPLEQLKQLWVRPQNIINKICNQALANNHYLGQISGPSGSGKSHLLALVYHQLRQQQDPPLLLVIEQNQWAIQQVNDLLLAMIQQLIHQQPQPQQDPWQQQLNQLYEGLSERQLGIQAEQLLNQLTHAKGGLILFDQFDRFYDHLDPQGLKQLKSLLTRQQQLSWLVCQDQATNFAHFEHLPLAELSLEQAQQLLIQTNRLQHQDQKQQPFDSPQGILCTKALHLLFSGISRHYVDFARVCHPPLLESFTPTVLDLLDQQQLNVKEQMIKLAPQQRQILAYLASLYPQHQGTASVTQIARFIRITHQTTSGQLKKMRTNALVKVNKIGRGAHYELANPLLALTLNLQQPPAWSSAHNNTSYLSLDFIRHWFTTAALDMPAMDNQCFVTDKQWLRHQYKPQSLPLVVKLKHLIDQYLQQLTQAQDHQFAPLREKLLALADNITNSPFTEQQHSSAISHIELLQGLICNQLLTTNKQSIGFEHATTLTLDMLDFASAINHGPLWQKLAQYSVKLCALYAIEHHSDQSNILIHALEQQEPEQRSLAFSIAIAQCQVYRTIGFSLSDNKSKTQQSLEQLRVRADKRNSPQIAGAYCHAVKQVITFMSVEDERLAQRLLRQVQDMVHKHQHHDLYFSVLWRLWAVNPEAIKFEQVLSLLEGLSQFDNFDHEIYLLLKQLRQPQHYHLLFQALHSINKTMVLCTGLIQVGLYWLNHQSDFFQPWFEQLKPILQTPEYDLAHSLRILTGLIRYQAHNQDPNQLLVLPQLERALIGEQLILG